MYNSTTATETIRGEQVLFEKRTWFSPVLHTGKAWVFKILTGPGHDDFAGKFNTKAEARAGARRMVKAYADEAKRSAEIKVALDHYDLNHLRGLLAEAENADLPGWPKARARERVALKVTFMTKGSEASRKASESGAFLPLKPADWVSFKLAAEKLLG